MFEVLGAITPKMVCLNVLLLVADRNAVCYHNTGILGHLSLCHKLLGGHFLNVIPPEKDATHLLFLGLALKDFEQLKETFSDGLIPCCRHSPFNQSEAIP